MKSTLYGVLPIPLMLYGIILYLIFESHVCLFVRSAFLYGFAIASSVENDPSIVNDFS